MTRAKNKIPLNDITKLVPFSNNGISAIVLHSKHHGQVWISDKTQQLPDLLKFLADYVPDGQNTKKEGQRASAENRP